MWAKLRPLLLLPFVFFVAEASYPVFWFYLLAALLAACVLILTGRKFAVPGPWLHVRLLGITLPFAAGLAILFYDRWITTRSVAGVAGLLRLSPSFLLIAVTVILACLSVLSLDYLISLFISLYKKLPEIPVKWLNITLRTVLRILVILLITFLEYAAALHSTLGSFKDLTTPKPWYLFMNLGMFLILNLICALIFARWKRSLIFTSVLWSVYAVVNCYVVALHGSPLFPHEFASFKTAMAVLSDYTFEIYPAVGLYIAILSLSLLLITAAFRREEKRTLLRFAAELTILAAFSLSIGFTAGKPAIASVGWSWLDEMRANGFSICVLGDTMTLFHPYKTPEGYDPEAIGEVETPETALPEELPDIILILNESFSDPDIYADIKPDGDFLADFYGIPGASYGYAAVPGSCGGTNNAEFELLTSKSMYLLNASAPFQFVDFEKAPGGIAEYLHTFGYLTTGMHCTAQNYNRSEAYPALGFDNVYLGIDYMTSERLEHRSFSDKAGYRDLIGYYEENKGTPQLFYLLTYQNHGGYARNSEEWDIYHTGCDYGELTDDLNEFLTSVSYSATAFRDLIEYFENSDRPMFICMVGDHHAPLLSSLPARPEITEEEDPIVKRLVPYVIWTNTDADLSSFTPYVSMIDLVPLTVKAAGLPLSGFYQTILDLHEDLPIRTSYGDYVDNEGNIGTYSPESPYYDALSRYYFMEYDSLTGGETLRPSLYFPHLTK